MKQLKLTIVLCCVFMTTMAQVARRYDVVINEIMADASPVVGLPNAAFIELKNVSTFPISLNGWRLGDGSGSTVITANFVLPPDGLVILCANAATSQFIAYGATLGVGSFPSLDNDGETVYLRSKEGIIIHAVAYSKNWYRNEVKSEGGWSLEMMDAHNPCSGASNWMASGAVLGGTPGKLNSVVNTNVDVQPPMLHHAFATDSITVEVFFDEPLDSAQIVQNQYYSISNEVGMPQSVTAIAPLFNSVVLKLKIPLLKNKVYALSAAQLKDCSGNSIAATDSIRLGWASALDSFAVVINELLFNPKPNGVDYIEIYNRGNNIIDLKDCYIAGRNNNEQLTVPKRLFTKSRLFFPGDYAVVTEDSLTVQKQYPSSLSRWFIQLSSLPSLPDDKGVIVLLNSNGKIIDELYYANNWHFQLMGNTEGVALERIDYRAATQNAANWHSAATTAGYGTPGYRNSQVKEAEPLTGNISIAPTVFSPDNDGWQDVITLSYRFEEPGYMCNTTIFDTQGRVVKNWIRSALCGLSGYFRWDGLSNTNQPLPTGMYIVYTEVFNLKGKTQRRKEVVTLARKQ